MSSDPLFDESARSFAANTDRLIANEMYWRGELFVRAAKNFVPPGGKILDYGCGPGRLARMLAREGYRVHGLDGSTGMLREARLQNLAGLELSFDQAGDDGKTLDADGYDAVVCSSTIEYVADAQGLLRNFHRSLRAEGVLILTYANRLSLWRKYAEWRAGGKAPHMKLQHHIWSFGECKSALVAAGFEVQGKPVIFEPPPFERPALRVLGVVPWMGTLGLVVARPCRIKRVG
jgi:ubiquinone/menaquinone biosynthesis C-methylase UbiE